MDEAKHPQIAAVELSDDQLDAVSGAEPNQTPPPSPAPAPSLQGPGATNLTGRQKLAIEEHRKAEAITKGML